MKYLGRRLFRAGLLLVGVSALCFLFTEMAPGSFFVEMRLSIVLVYGHQTASDDDAIAAEITEALGDDRGEVANGSNLVDEQHDANRLRTSFRRLRLRESAGREQR